MDSVCFCDARTGVAVESRCRASADLSNLGPGPIRDFVGEAYHGL